MLLTSFSDEEIFFSGISRATLLGGKPLPERLQELARLDAGLRSGQLEETLCFAGQPVATRRHLSPYFEPRTVAGGGHLRLSRFACCRRQDDFLLLESPRCHVALRFHDWRGPALLDHFCGRPLPDALDGDLALKLSALLAESGFLCNPAEEESEPLAGWEFHDYFFHSRSRDGRHRNRSGKVSPPAATAPPLPPASGPRVALQRPDLTRLASEDPPFTRVLESRRSLRTPSSPLTLGQLGEFLYRCCHSETGKRPTPGAGCVHALDLFVCVGRCPDLAAGLYRYDCTRHELESLPGAEHSSTLLMARAAKAQGEGNPQVLLIMAARFGDMQRRYQSLAYSLLLKDVGCLQQTMYLVATAMRLHPCALGSGNSELFARATGQDYALLGSVGEFALN